MYCNSISEDNFNSSRICSTVENKRLKTSECFVKSIFIFFFVIFVLIIDTIFNFLFKIIDTKVHNNSKPCNIQIDSGGKNKCTLSNNINSVKPDLNERISNLEKCLNIKNDKSDNMNIYEKLKSIENRVLNLQMKLFNNEENHSLNIYTDDQYMEVINQNLKLSNHTQVNLLVFFFFYLHKQCFQYGFWVVCEISLLFQK